MPKTKHEEALRRWGTAAIIKGRARCGVVFEVPFWAAPYALVCRLALRRLARLAVAGP